MITVLLNCSSTFRLPQCFKSSEIKNCTDIASPPSTLCRVYLRPTSDGENLYFPLTGKLFEGGLTSLVLKGSIKKTNVVNIFGMTMSSISQCQKNQP